MKSLFFIIMGCLGGIVIMLDKHHATLYGLGVMAVAISIPMALLMSPLGYKIPGGLREILFIATIGIATVVAFSSFR